ASGWASCSAGGTSIQRRSPPRSPGRDLTRRGCRRAGDGDRGRGAGYDRRTMATTRIRTSRPLPLALSALAALLVVACAAPPPPVTPAAPPTKRAPPPDLARAAALETEARQLLEVGIFSDAQRAALEAERIYQQLRGPRHPDTGRAAELLASIKL